MKQFTFTSQLAPIIWKYLESRQNEGYTSVHCGYYMQELDCLSKELSDAPVVTKELIDAWDLLKPYLSNRSKIVRHNGESIDIGCHGCVNFCAKRLQLVLPFGQTLAEYIRIDKIVEVQITAAPLCTQRCMCRYAFSRKWMNKTLRMHPFTKCWTAVG